MDSQHDAGGNAIARQRGGGSVVVFVSATVTVVPG